MPGGRRWAGRLGAIALVGLAIRLVYILGFRRDDPNPFAGDPWYWHAAANLLADGKGFIEPAPYLMFLRGAVPASGHPPGYIVVLALPALLGLKSALTQRIWSALLGTTTIVVVGLCGRRIAGPRVGLVAAAIAAVYPNFWVNDGLLMSETLTLLLVALVVLVAYALRDRQTRSRALLLGVAAGALALTRGEGLVVLIAVVLPFVLFVVPGAWRRRAALSLLVALAAGVTVLPWIAYNNTRFDHPVLIATSLGITMRQGACDQTFSGTLIGYWEFTCAGLGKPIHGDASSVDSELRHRALDYEFAHAGRLPLVVLARLGRTFGFFQPRYQLELDHRENTREVPVAAAGLLMYYPLLLAAIAGVVVLRRRAVPVSLLLGIVGVVALTVAITFGQTRYRAPAEVPLVLLAAVGLVAARDGQVRPRSHAALP